MKKTVKSNPLKTFNDNKALAVKKMNGAQTSFKKSLPKAQAGLGTPFQQYMKIPGAVASDTSNIYNTPKSGSTLDNAFSATYGNDYKQKAIDYNTLEKFRGDNSEYKKPLKKGTGIKKTGGSVKKITKFAALAPPYNKATAADRIAGAKKNKKK